MKKLLVMVLVTALCLPCYGTIAEHNIIVYKLTCSFNPWIDYNDANKVQATVGPKKVNGYLVFDVDMHDANKPSFNQDPNIIFYVNDEGEKLVTYFPLSQAGQVKVNIFDTDAKGNKGLYLFIDEEANYGLVHNILSDLYGKIGLVDIGRYDKIKKRIASSLKGTAAAWADSIEYFEAFGNITATLDTKFTKPANAANPPQSQGAVTNAIIAYLEAQDYNILS